MDETEDCCTRRELLESLDDGNVGCKVAVELARFNIEDIDQDTDVKEDIFTLGIEEIVGECVLPGETSVRAK